MRHCDFRVLPFFLSLLWLLLPPVLHSAEKPQNGFLPAAIGKSLSYPETSNKPSQDMADDAVTLRDMGAGGPLLLTGTEEGESFWFGVSTDEVVHRATLQIRFTSSPALIPELSHLKIYLNQEVVAVVDLPKDKAGKPQSADIELDPRYLSSANNLRFQLVGHYSRDCEDPLHSSLWLNISNLSTLQLWTRKINLPNDLALFPSPFLDMHANQRSTIPFYFNGRPDTAMARASGIVASWLGTQAGSRRVMYPVSYDKLPEQHAILLLTNRTIPPGLKLKRVDAPTLLVTEHPEHPEVKFLVIIGRESADLVSAATALVLGNGILSGPVATVSAPALPPPRLPYDSPNWVSTQHVTRLGDLVRNADELQVKGAKPGPIRLEFRIPPDLLIWEHSEIGLKLNYRYTPPITEEQSYLSLYTNGNLLKSLRLKPSTDQSSIGQRIRLVDQQHAYSEDFRIPAFQLGADNTLDLRFFSSDYRQGWCMANSVDSFLASIDADSTIDFRGFHHYVAMPDLGSFAQSGFPFTKLADLGETRVLLPAEPSEHDIQAMLVMLSEMGLSTGVPAVRFEIQLGEDTTHLHDRDLLVISTGSTHPLIRQWASFSPASFDNEARTFGQAFEWNRIFRFTDLESFTQKIRHIGANRFKAYGALAALTGFESPVQKGRSVISFEANDPEEAHHALLTFSEKSTLRYVDDDVAIFRKGEVQSYEVGPSYFTGDIPPWMWLEFHLTRHPALLAILSLGFGLFIAFLLYQMLILRRHQRLRKP